VGGGGVNVLLFSTLSADLKSRRICSASCVNHKGEPLAVPAAAVNLNNDQLYTFLIAGDCLSDGHGRPVNTSRRSNMNSTIWKEFDLGEHLDSLAGPYLGSMDVTVRCAEPLPPISAQCVKLNTKNN
jgi:hypothetical protein